MIMFLWLCPAPLSLIKLRSIYRNMHMHAQNVCDVTYASLKSRLWGCVCPRSREDRLHGIQQVRVGYYYHQALLPWRSIQYSICIANITELTCGTRATSRGEELVVATHWQTANTPFSRHFSRRAQKKRVLPLTTYDKYIYEPGGLCS